MNNFQSVEVCRYICERAIESIPSFGEQMQLEMKAILRSSNSGRIVAVRLAAYLLGKL